MTATIASVRPLLAKEKLKVVAVLKTKEGKQCEAFMPDREVAAILPRSVLLGGSATAPESLLATIAPILERMSEGRAVRVWSYKDRMFFSFLPWKSVRFRPDPAAPA